MPGVWLITEPMVADALDVGDHFERGRDEAKVACDRLLLKQQFQAQTFNVLFHLVNLIIRLPNRLCLLHVSILKRHSRLINGNLAQFSHMSQLLIEAL